MFRRQSIPEVVECVPNFSAGKDRKKVQAIVDVIQQGGGNILHVDRGEAANRTVVTFTGDRHTILEAAWQGVKKASQVIDMRNHQGVHPRLGATDVCPFVPIQNVSMQDCVAISEKLGERVARELNIPVYLYEEAARKPERKNLANIRRGEYEGLKKKMQNPNWQPDFKAEFNARSGALVTGARKFLIAYNVNLNTHDTQAAQEIARRIRTSGWTIDKDGRKIHKPGIFDAVKAVGWYIEEYQCAQVSMNLTDYQKTLPHQVFEKISELAEEKGLKVTGSEVIGLILKQPLLKAGRFYFEKVGRDLNSVSEKELIEVGIEYLGLNDVQEFDPEKKILEYKIGV
ncbi:MAG: glutamate formimidoyltransferase [Candidatus Marinimicrobia bacterium]|nr:glutamate formimidoyltransferase [Candidatus Neomarinimicrobiota bacterium]